MNWELCLAWAQESANQSLLDKLCQENKLSIEDWLIRARYHYQWSLGHVWHVEGQYDDWSWWSLEINNLAGRVRGKIKTSSWCPENPINSRIGGKDWSKVLPKDFFSSKDGACSASTIGQNPPNNAKVKVEKWAIWSENMTQSANGLMVSFDPGIKRQFQCSCSGQSWEIWRFFHLNQWLLKYTFYSCG